MDSPPEEVPSDQPSPTENEVYYPRDSTDATEVFDTLRQWLPSELALEILEQAGYWLLSRVARKDSIRYIEASCHNHNHYLISEPIQGERGPIREIRFSIDSHDQGWSDHDEDHGTFRNSWTWFDLRVRPEEGEGSARHVVRLATNLHARSETFRHEIVYRADRDDWVLRLQSGDQLCIVPRARFPGWRNYVEAASMEIYTAPVL